MSDTQITDTGVELTPEQAARFRRLRGAMHYGGSIAHTPRRHGEPVSVDDVLDYIEALGITLVGVARRDNENEAELRQIKSDLAAVGRVFRPLLGLDS